MSTQTTKRASDSLDPLVRLCLSAYLNEECQGCHKTFETLDDLIGAVWWPWEKGRVGHKACYQSNERSEGSLERSGSAHVGDKYHRLGSSIEITEVTATHVVWQLTDAHGCSTHSATHEDFARMEAKSLEWGARFEPAPNESSSATTELSANNNPKP